jgi:hypothetical protein
LIDGELSNRFHAWGPSQLAGTTGVGS